MGAGVARTLPVGTVRVAARLAGEHGWDVDALLAGAGLTPQALRSPHGRVTDEQLVTIVQSLWRHTDDELFGLGRTALPRGSFRLLCYGMAGSVDLREVLTRLQGFVKAMPAVPVIVELGEHTTRIGMTPMRSTPVVDLMQVLGLGCARSLVSWTVGRPIPMSSVQFAGPRDGLGDLAEFLLGPAVAFDRPVSRIEFDSRWLAAPLVRSEADIEELIAHSPRDLLVRPPDAAGTAGQVRTMLAAGLRRGDGRVPAEEIARRMSVSQPTLRRRLAAEGTSVRTLQQDAVRAAAVTGLVDTAEPVGELAVRLGFSEPSAFVRAFRRWTGTSPAAYRRQAQQRSPVAAPGTD